MASLRVLPDVVLAHEVERCGLACCHTFGAGGSDLNRPGYLPKRLPTAAHVRLLLRLFIVDKLSVGSDTVPMGVVALRDLGAGSASPPKQPSKPAYCLALPLASLPLDIRFWEEEIRMAMMGGSITQNNDITIGSNGIFKLFEEYNFSTTFLGAKSQEI